MAVERLFETFAAHHDPSDLLDALLTGIVLLDADFRIIHANVSRNRLGCQLGTKVFKSVVSPPSFSTSLARTNSGLTRASSECPVSSVASASASLSDTRLLEQTFTI